MKIWDALILARWEAGIKARRLAFVQEWILRFPRILEHGEAMCFPVNGAFNICMLRFLITILHPSR